MNEPVKPIGVTFFMRVIFEAHPWKALDPEAKRFATVNQADIRVLRARRRTGTQDDDSSGAASIFRRASWMTLNHPLHKAAPRVLRSVAPPPGPGLSKEHSILAHDRKMMIRRLALKFIPGQPYRPGINHGPEARKKALLWHQETTAFFTRLGRVNFVSTASKQSFRTERNLRHCISSPILQVVATAGKCRAIAHTNPANSRATATAVT